MNMTYDIKVDIIEIKRNAKGKVIANTIKMVIELNHCSIEEVRQNIPLLREMAAAKGLTLRTCIARENTYATKTVEELLETEK